MQKNSKYVMMVLRIEIMTASKGSGFGAILALP
jgi:hypothetical protein